MINERALRVLEFNKILELLEAFALTDGGKDVCRQLKPDSDLKAVAHSQAETEEAVVLLSRLGGNPLTAFSDVNDALSLAEKGAVLSPGRLLQVAEALRAARNARAQLVTDREETPLITAEASQLRPNQALERDITDAILSEEEIADHASAQLLDIRRHISRANDRIREKLNALAHGSAYAKYLQESIVTVRNGRYVLPVRAEFRANVPGIVQDQSSTGATVFIEPLAVVELSNDIREWQAKEKQEIERILAALSAEVGQDADAISRNIAILTHLDFCFAKGMLSRQMRAISPKLNDRGYLNFVRVRHPLIDPDRVVPLSLSLGDSYTSLIITGPNTGGKTVTLKSVGLISLMAQAGLQVPGELGTEVAVFHNIFADIGDEQSIEQSLSTFSSHMTNIVSIMNEVDDRDLTLFDELGAGTDPTEGAALAQAILQALLSRGVRTVATTHYSELKAFAMTTPHAENASMEFDVASLRPTYRLSIGVPGKSNAFEISRRLGLSEALIDSAKDLLSHESVRFEDVIASAEYHQQVAERERQLAEDARKETVRLRDEAERLYQETEEKRRNANTRAKEEARRIVENARREAQEVLSELKRLKAENKAQAQQLNTRLEKTLDSLSEGLQTASAPLVRKNQRPLIKGDIVQILSLNSKGTVLKEADEKGEVLVQAGIIKCKLPVEQLVLEDAPAPAKKTQVQAHHDSKYSVVPLQVDVRGMALDEALEAVDRYLDQVVMAGYHEVTIVHGKGTGVLRAGIHQHLKKHHVVKSYRLGQYGEGEDGVTLVTLK